MGKRKRHHKATNSLETLAEKKLPQGLGQGGRQNSKKLQSI